MVFKSSQPKKGKGCLKIFLIILFSPIILVLGVMAVTIIISIIQNKPDAEVLKSYKPTAEIAEIAEKTGLTDKGKAQFYRDDPTFVDAASFMKYCRTQARGIEPLGCNAPRPGGGPFGGRQVFLLQIDDPRFADHKYSAAIHEMLHSAYNRLTSKEEKRINVLLDQEFSKSQDPSLKEVIERLKKIKKGEIKAAWGELHSKFAVEYSELSPELEDYYKQYFLDRRKAVELFQQGGFGSRVARIDGIRYELSLLAPQLTSMQDQLTTYQNAGDEVNFNNLVGQYNNMVSQYNTKVAESQRAYNEIQEFYKYFNPDYQPPESKVK